MDRIQLQTRSTHGGASQSHVSRSGRAVSRNQQDSSSELQEMSERRRKDSDPLFSMEDDEETPDGDQLKKSRKKKKDDKIPFTPEVSILLDSPFLKSFIPLKTEG